VPQSGMEDDAFGRCYVACMNRCADDCRRDPAICPGARGPRSAAGSAPPSAGPPTWSRQTGNSPLFFPYLRTADAGPKPRRGGGGAEKVEPTPSRPYKGKKGNYSGENTRSCTKVLSIFISASIKAYRPCLAKESSSFASILVNSIILFTSSNISSAILLFFHIPLSLHAHKALRPQDDRRPRTPGRRGDTPAEAQVEPRRRRREATSGIDTPRGSRRSAKYGTNAPSIRTVAKANGTESV